MAFHLEGPWLSTIGKKKGKVKHKSSAHAKQKRQLEEEWRQRELEWKKMSPMYGKTTPTVTVKKTETISQPVRAHEKSGKSLNSWVTGPVSSKPSQQYTGDNVKGIAVMHKSCLQPVFNQEAMIDSAKMRR